MTSLRPLTPVSLIALLATTLLAACQRADDDAANSANRTPTASSTGGDAANIRGSVLPGTGAAGADAAASAASGARP